MNSLRIEALKALVYMTVTGIPTYLFTDYSNKTKEEKLEVLSSKSTEYRLMYEENSKEIELLKTDIFNKENSLELLSQVYDSLNYKYNILEDKYNKLISSDGSYYTQEPLNDDIHQESFRKGDKLEYRLITNKLILNFVKVSDRGPLIEIQGCENYVISNSIKIYENNRTFYLLTYSKPFNLKYTCYSCEDGKNMEPTEIESITIELENFSVDDQTFQIKYSRKFLFK